MTTCEQLVEDLAQAIGRGVSLEDLDGLLLAYSSNQQDADPVRVEFLLAKRVPVQVADWQRSHGIEQSIRPVVIPANESLGMRPRVCAPLLHRGFRVGYIWIQLDDVADGPVIVARLAECAERTAALAERILETNTGQTEYRRAREAVFLSACQGRQSALTELADWPQIHGTGPWQLAAMTLVDPRSGGERPSSPPVRLALTGDDTDIIHRTAALRATLGHERAVFSAGSATHALILFSAREDLAFPGLGRGAEDRTVIGHGYAEEARARGSLSDVRLILGYSEPFRELSALPSRRSQAVAAMQALAVDRFTVSDQARLLNPGMGAGGAGAGGLGAGGDFLPGEDRSLRVDWSSQADYRGLGVYQFLAGSRLGQSPVKSSSFTTLTRQPDADELLILLERLYERSEPVAELARNLHIHRSSVYNKLARVRSLIGADPLVGAVRLELHLAMKAARWERRPRL